MKECDEKGEKENSRRNPKDFGIIFLVFLLEKFFYYRYYEKFRRALLSNFLFTLRLNLHKSNK